VTAAGAGVAPQESVACHLREHVEAVCQLLSYGEQIERWGAHLGRRLREGRRLLVAGNGGSAAEAEHLAAELLGRFLTDREPLPAIALPGQVSSLSAIANDYGWEEAYARAVRGHGRPGDVLLTLSTSGRSSNLLRAAEVARSLGLHTWALTGAIPNPLQQASDETIAISGTTPLVQESHLVAIHLLCSCIDRT
jgi:phosphoheptose isomerase